MYVHTSISEKLNKIIIQSMPEMAWTEIALRVQYGTGINIGNYTEFQSIPINY